MIPLRQVYNDAPAFIPVPEALRHHRIEVTLLALDAEPQNQGQRRRAPPPQFAGKVRELGDVMGSVPAADWGSA